MPNNFFQKTSGLLSGNLQVTDKFSTTANLQYVRNSARNRPGTGYNVGIMEGMIWFGRQVDMNALKANYNQPGSINGGPADREYNWNYNFHNNPFWLQNDNPLTDARDRIVASASATYKLLDWVNATLSSGSDIYNYNINQDYAHGNLQWADPSYAGGFNDITDYRNENNTQMLLTGTHSIGSRIQFNGTAGGNLRAEQESTNQTQTSGISVAGIYNVSNAAIAPTLTDALTRRQVNSVFGSAAFTYNNWWTVEGTARNDWSSTLPQGANSYFYPSVNTSVVLSDAIPSLKDHGVSFLKLRASVAQVGNDANPYSASHDVRWQREQVQRSSAVLAERRDRQPDPQAGDHQLQRGRRRARILRRPDYARRQHLRQGDEESDLQRRHLTGHRFRLEVGERRRDRQQRRGSPADARSPSHRTGLRVVDDAELHAQPQQGCRTGSGHPVDQSRSTWSTNTQARLGDPYGDIYGYSFLRDSATHKLITIPATRPDGLPEGLTTRGPLKVLGNIQPNWIGSWNNSFTYKNYSLNVLMDARRGGQFFSVSNFWGDYAGITQNSLLGRGIDWNNPGYVVPGIAKQTCGAGSHTDAAGDYVCVGGGQPNTAPATSEDYFQNIYPVVENSILTDNWIKLREVRLGVELPTRLANRLRVSAANFSIVGRNLWMSTSVPNIDPEFSYSTGNDQGSEFAALPNARSVGFSLRVTP